MQKTIQNFNDLFVWQKGHLLVLETYKATKTFPNEEMFGLISQMRRCAVSITSNIAEGFSRRNKKEKAQFYYIAQGSISELKNQIHVSKDVGYLNQNDAIFLLDLSDSVARLLSPLINKQNINPSL